jgi:transcriptional regulator with XRE-family HTH domain
MVKGFEHRAMPKESDIRKLLGRRVRARRESQRLTQVQLADKIRVDDSTVRAIELGRRGASLETLFALAAALGTSPGALLGDGGIVDPGSEVAEILASMDPEWKKTSLDILRALQRQSRRPK